MSAAQTATPGPWEIGTPGPNKCPTIGHKGLMVATVAHGDDHPTYANARLIAAAPELLEALDWLVQILPDPELDNDELQRTWTKKARTAIAKATGSQP